MDNHWASITGWCNFQNIYLDQVNRVKSGLFLEVGSWQGQSSCYMAEAIKDSGKQISLVCVDLWPTDEEIQVHADKGAGQSVEGDMIRALPEPILNVFVKNMRMAGVENIVIPVKSDSIKASTIFPDEHFDFIYLDNGHYEDHVYKELYAWWPRLKRNSVYAGHDFDSPPVANAVNRFAKEMGLVVHRDLASWIIHKD